MFLRLKHFLVVFIAFIKNTTGEEVVNTTDKDEIINPYCSMNCNGVVHTVCKYGPCVMTPDNCGPSFQMLTLNDIDQEIILRLHNSFRNKAITSATWKAIPIVSKMNYMSYDLELEFIAQCYANLCVKNNTHDKCRKTKTFENVAQNVITIDIIKGDELADFDKNRFLIDGFQKWIDEEKFVKAEDFDAFTAHNYSNVVNIVTGHIRNIGCGMVYFKLDEVPSVNLVCNYAPGIINEPALMGVKTNYELCSTCTCGSKEYPNLCTLSEYPKAKFKPLYNFTAFAADEGYNFQDENGLLFQDGLNKDYYTDYKYEDYDDFNDDRGKVNGGFNIINYNLILLLSFCCAQL